MDTTTTTAHHADCRHIPGSGWCCALKCAHSTHRPMIAMAGRVKAAVPMGAEVEIWCQSPTGGDSDCQIFHLRCNTPEQAEMIATQWQARWNL